MKTFTDIVKTAIDTLDKEIIWHILKYPKINKTDISYIFLFAYENIENDCEFINILRYIIEHKLISLTDIISCDNDNLNNTYICDIVSYILRMCGDNVGYKLLDFTSDIRKICLSGDIDLIRCMIVRGILLNSDREVVFEKISKKLLFISMGNDKALAILNTLNIHIDRYYFAINDDGSLMYHYPEKKGIFDKMDVIKRKSDESDEIKNPVFKVPILLKALMKGTDKIYMSLSKDPEKVSETIDYILKEKPEGYEEYLNKLMDL